MLFAFHPSIYLFIYYACVDNAYLHIHKKKKLVYLYYSFHICDFIFFPSLLSLIHICPTTPHTRIHDHTHTHIYIYFPKSAADKTGMDESVTLTFWMTRWIRQVMHVTGSTQERDASLKKFLSVSTRSSSHLHYLTLSIPPPPPPFLFHAFVPFMVSLVLLTLHLHAPQSSFDVEMASSMTTTFRDCPCQAHARVYWGGGAPIPLLR